MKDSVGQDHRRRHFFPEGPTKEVGLHSMRQEGTLCRQGKVHWEAPDTNAEHNKRRRETLPGGKVPQHVDPEVARLPLDGYEWAIEESALVGKVEPWEAPVKLHGFRLKGTQNQDVQKIEQCSPHQGRGGRLGGHSRREDDFELKPWLAEGWYKASEKKKRFEEK